MIVANKHLLSAGGGAVSMKKDKVPMVTMLICYLGA